MVDPDEDDDIDFDTIFKTVLSLSEAKRRLANLVRPDTTIVQDI